MLFEKLDGILAGVMKNEARFTDENGQDTNWPKDVVISTLRGIKTEMVNATHDGITLPNDKEEMRILRKMIDRNTKAADIYRQAGEQGRADRELVEAEIIAYFMPKQTGPTKEQVETETHCVIENLIRLKSMTDGGFDGNIMRFTKDIIAKVKEKYPDAENSVIAAAVKSYR